MLDLTRPISPSQIGTAGKCGWAWEYNYDENMKPPKVGVPLLTGSVAHWAHERWIMDRTQDLILLTEQAWEALFAEEPTMLRLIKAFERLNKQGIELIQKIHAERPEIKEPTRTNDWKKSPIGIAINKFEYQNKRILEKDKHDWEKKPFTQAYLNTIELATIYQERWATYPNAMMSEVGYNIAVEHQGVALDLVGYIDEVNILINDDGEVLGYLISDYKTYSREPNPLKDFIQLAHYRIAADQLMPLWCEAVDVEFHPEYPIYCAVDLAWMLRREVYLFDEKQLKLALTLTKNYDATRNMPKLPDFKSMSCDYCEWLEECTARVGMKAVTV